MFLRWACSNILPTRESLHKRRVRVDPLFELCCQQPETVGHLLWECPLARKFWALYNCGGIQKCPNTRCDFIMLLRMMVDRLALHDLEKWAVTSWAIWNVRNNYYFERIQIHPKEFLNGGSRFSAWVLEMHGSSTARQRRWVSSLKHRRYRDNTGILFFKMENDVHGLYYQFSLPLFSVYWNRGHTFVLFDLYQ